MADKSKGHIEFIGTREFFEFNGSVCSADVAKPIMPDGYRPARFACFVGYWECCKRIELASLANRQA